jgi:hypothetical protein
MFIAGALCVCAAVVMAARGLWSLSRPVATDTTAVVMRAIAPPQLAAAVMLAAGGAVALAAPRDSALPVAAVCIAGALGTVAVGAWQGARYALRRDTAGCGSVCATCTIACR